MIVKVVIIVKIIALFEIVFMSVSHGLSVRTYLQKLIDVAS